MEAFLTSTAAVAVAEIGDKTQLLALFLAARFATEKKSILLGILVATLINHAFSAWAGDWLSQYMTGALSQWIISLSFIGLGVWLLVPDKDESEDTSALKYGAFLATTLLFFLAEIGDKTQLATVLLGAQFQSVVAVTLGTTLGMLLANAPVVLAGGWILQRLPMQLIRRLASAGFILTGIWWLLRSGVLF